MHQSDSLSYYIVVLKCGLNDVACDFYILMLTRYTQSKNKWHNNISTVIFQV